jgi:hypothetical protein
VYRCPQVDQGDPGGEAAVERGLLAFFSEVGVVGVVRAPA